jgi:putative transposase
MAVPQVYANLLDEGVFLCSISTMYRLLRARDETTERRRQREHKPFQRPELLATGPNQVWSWDITKLKGPRKWSYFYLYVILDVFSRYVVGWMIAEREGADLARVLVEQSVARQNVPAGQLTIHADRGSAMISKSLADLLFDLGVDKSHSRPHVSNDNPFSESHFKTLKYRPEVPERFGSAEEARELFRDLFAWYNEEHRHSGIAMLTPHMVHSGQAAPLLAARQGVLCEAYTAHPARFVKRAPKVEQLPAAVWINPPAAPEEATEQQAQVAAAAPPKPQRCPRGDGQGEHPSDPESADALHKAGRMLRSLAP